MIASILALALLCLTHATTTMNVGYFEFYSRDNCMGNVVDSYYISPNTCSTYHNTDSFHFSESGTLLMVNQFSGYGCQNTALQSHMLFSGDCLSVVNPFEAAGRSARVSLVPATSWPDTKEGMVSLQRCAFSSNCADGCGDGHFGVRASGSCTNSGTSSSMYTCGSGGQLLQISWTATDCMAQTLEGAKVVTASGVAQCLTGAGGATSRVVSCRKDASTCTLTCRVHGKAQCHFALADTPESRAHTYALTSGYSLPPSAVAVCGPDSWPATDLVPLCTGGAGVELLCVARTSSVRDDVAQFMTPVALRAYLTGRYAYIEPIDGDNAVCDGAGKMMGVCPESASACSRCFDHDASTTLNRQATVERPNGQVTVICVDEDGDECFKDAACLGLTERSGCYRASGERVTCPDCPSSSSKSGWIALILCLTLIPIIASCCLLCLMFLVKWLRKPRWKEGPYVHSEITAATACQCPTVNLPTYDAPTVDATVMGSPAHSYYHSPPRSFHSPLHSPHALLPPPAGLYPTLLT